MSGSSRYTPLPSKRSFRLLRRVGGQEKNGSSHSGLQYSLDIFDLDDVTLQYVALSYTWGSPCDDPSIIDQYSSANDKTISISHGGRKPCEHRIGKNLYDALSQIFETKWQSLIWVDAICINQSDIDERGSQVQLMGDIYSRPQFVISWLGPEPQRIDELLWWYGPFLEYLCGISDDDDDEDDVPDMSLEDMLPKPTYRYDTDLDETVLVFQNTEMSIQTSKVIVLLDWFRQTRYWSRSWIHQEVALPKDVCFLLGRYELPKVTSPDVSSTDAPNLLWLWLGSNAEIIRTVIGLNIDAGRAIHMPPPPITFAIGPVRSEIALPNGEANSYKVRRRQWFGGSDDTSDYLALLELLLARNNHLVASDPRDKIYSLLGTINRCVRPSVEVIPATYKLTVREMLKAVTIRLLTDLPYMTCFALRSPSYYPRMKGLPSWVIDTTAMSRSILPGGLATRRQTPYNACPTRDQQNATVELDGDAIHLYGHYCGDITSLLQGISENFEAPGFVYEHNRMLLRTAEAIRDSLRLGKDIGSHYKWIDGQPIFEAIVETMTVSRDAEGLLAPHITADAFWIVAKRYLRRMVELTREHDPTTATTARGYLDDCKELVINLAQSGVSVPESLLAYVNRLSTEDLDLNAFEAQELFDAETPVAVPFIQNSLMADRIVFRTNHDFLGLAADDLKPGDQLWILCRARVPQILRPLPDGTFETLGEAYVHGGVDGELIEKGIAGPLRRITMV